VDGVTVADYEKELDGNLRRLLGLVGNGESYLNIPG
jgi:hypothetical protein